MANAPKKVDFTIYQGRTFQYVFRWEQKPLVYKAITAIAKTAPVRITATGHGLKDGWYAAVTDVKGMTQINAEANSPRDSDFHQVTVIDANTVDINDISAASFSTYTSGGYLRYYTPASLSGFTARMDIKDKVGGTIMDSFDELTGIELDDTNHTITLTITATDTTAYTWTKGVYDIELISGTGVITPLAQGTVTVVPEVTTSI